MRNLWQNCVARALDNEPHAESAEQEVLLHLTGLFPQERGWPRETNTLPGNHVVDPLPT